MVKELRISKPQGLKREIWCSQMTDKHCSMHPISKLNSHEPERNQLLFLTSNDNVNGIFSRLMLHFAIHTSTEAGWFPPNQTLIWWRCFKGILLSGWFVLQRDLIQRMKITRHFMENLVVCVRRLWSTATKPLTVILFRSPRTRARNKNFLSILSTVRCSDKLTYFWLLGEVIFWCQLHPLVWIARQEVTPDSRCVWRRCILFCLFPVVVVMYAMFIALLPNVQWLRNRIIWPIIKVLWLFHTH